MEQAIVTPPQSSPPRLRLIAGRAGTGKTHRVLEEIAAACRADPHGSALVLLVPEQASYLTERALLEVGGLDGYTRAQVLSFTRLAEYLFARGPAPHRPRLTATHRALLCMLLVGRLRRAEPAGIVHARGLEDALSQFVAESRQYAMPAEKLRAALDALRTGVLAPGRHARRSLEVKLEQLTRLLEQFDALVGERFEDPQDTLLNLSESIVRSNLLQGMELTVDGFLTFTPVEERLLTALARKAARLTLVLPLDPERAAALLAGRPLRRHPVFTPVEEGVERLLRFFGEAGLPLPQLETQSTPRRATTPGLRLLATGFLEPDRPAPCDDARSVEFWEAADVRQEARFAVELIARWMREEGWRPSEVGILARDLDAYARPLAEALRTLRIPFFIDRSEPLENHPLVVGIQALIRAGLRPARQDFLLALAKSGLLPLERRSADLLDFHVRQFPRSYAAWFSEAVWQAPPPRSPMVEEGEEILDEFPFQAEIDRARRVVVAVVNEFRQQLPVDQAATGCLRDFLLALDAVVTPLLELRGQDPEEEPIQRQIGELLAEAVEAAGEEPVGWEAAGELAIRALADLSLPRIPPLLGQVFVGELDRSRQPTLRGVVVLGLAEGHFPRVAANMTLLSDGERDLLESAGAALRPSSRRLFEREAHLAYRGLTAASERLALLRPCASDRGDALNPSPWWTEVRALLPGAEPQRVPAEVDPQRCWRARELAASASRRLDSLEAREAPKELRARRELERARARLYPDLRHAGGIPVEAEAVLRAAMHRNGAGVSRHLVAQFFRNQIRASASQLEAFGQCPFRHYTAFMLRPLQVLLPEFEARDAGNLAHAVLRNFTRILRDEELIGKPIDPAHLQMLFEEAVEEPHARLRESGLLDSHAGRWLLDVLLLRLRDVAGWLVQSFTEVALHPVAEETQIGRNPGDGMTPLVFPDFLPGWSLELRGRIDRLDAAGGPRASARVLVDYKLRSRTFDFAAWRARLNLQLPLYLLTAAGQEPASPQRAGGALFLGILLRSQEKERLYDGILRASLIPSLIPVVDWKALPSLKSPRANPHVKRGRSGCVVTDAEFDAVLEATRTMTVALARGIAEGNASVFPARVGKVALPCERCEARPVCHVDFRMNGVHQHPARRREEVLEELVPQGTAEDDE